MLKFYNSRTNRIEVFHKTTEQIGIYSCGPTVYDKIHIGNLRTFIFSDFVASLLEYLYPGNVKAIMNITDVDDKIINKLPSQDQETLRTFTDTYTRFFLSDLNKLLINRYDDNHMKVTDHINDIEKFITTLADKGYCYELDDGNIYFDSSKIENYPFPGFSRNAHDDYESEREIIRPDGVRDSRDFVLWKVPIKEEVSWSIKSPFSNRLIGGRPGWHIECSTLACKHLKHVNIHMGGEDLKFPHHTCEILQSESANPEEKFGDYWLHVHFLTVDGKKMSKSLGNMINLEQLISNKDNGGHSYNPYFLRYYFLTKHYRSLSDFSLPDLESFRDAFTNLQFLYARVSKFRILPIEQCKTMFLKEALESILNDFNTSRALKSLTKKINKFLEQKELTDWERNSLLSELTEFNTFMKILDPSLINIPNNVETQMIERQRLRKLGLFKQSDEIRTRLSQDYIIYDTNSDDSYLMIIVKF